MITLYGFGTIFPEGIGETKDLRVQWALEELGLPYRVHAIDHTAGEHEGPAYSRISPFHQVPAIDDDGFVIAESAAILLYLAEKAGTLMPTDVQGRTHVMQWCFAAVSTIAPTLASIEMGEMFDPDKAAPKFHAGMRQVADRWFADLEKRLAGREWIATADFTVADILMANVLRNVRQMKLIEPYPNIVAYYARCHARPAWQRTLELYAKRLGVTVDRIR
ncbi:MAG TPA: glutathione S-transferase family protein [Kofleriaceae bacterium]